MLRHVIMSAMSAIGMAMHAMMRALCLSKFFSMLSKRFSKLLNLSSIFSFRFRISVSIFLFRLWISVSIFPFRFWISAFITAISVSIAVSSVSACKGNAIREQSIKSVSIVFIGCSRVLQFGLSPCNGGRVADRKPRFPIVAVPPKTGFK